MTRCVFCVALLLTIPIPSAATTWTVAPDGSGDAPTIAEAITLAAPADTVRLLPGTYLENDLYVPKELTIRGAGDADTVLLDGSGGDYLFRPGLTGNTEPFTVRLERLTMLGTSYAVRFLTGNCGLAMDSCRVVGCYRGVYSTVSDTNPVDLDGCEFMTCTVAVRICNGTIRNCRFLGNSDGVQLGGSSVLSDCVISDCEFEGQVTAILASQSRLSPPVQISDCDFHDQLANSIYVAGAGSAEIRRCTFTRNGEPFHYNVLGPGVRASTSSLLVTVSDCRFEENRARLGGALYFYRNNSALLPTVTNCEFVGNIADRGGVLRTLGLDVRMEDCFLIDNSALAGGAFEISDADVVAERCTFEGSFADTASIARVDIGEFRSIASLFTATSGDVLFRRIDFRSDFLAECSGFYDITDAGPDTVVSRMLREPTNFSAAPLYCDPSAASYRIGDRSRCAPANSPCGGQVGAGDVGCSPSGAYLATRPDGLTVTGDGESRVSDAFFDWNPGESHTVSVTTPQILEDGQRFDFMGWDDGGDVTHAISVGTANVAATAYFDVSYRLRMESWEGGAALPATGHHPVGTVVEIRAEAEDGYAFMGWVGTGAGSYTGSDTTATVRLDEPITQTARFTPGTKVTILSDPPGGAVHVHQQTMTTPATFYWATGSAVPLSVDSLQTTGEGERLRYRSWSDGGFRTHNVLAEGAPIELSVSFARDYQLTFEPDENVTVAPGDSWWESGSSVQIQAIPRYAYVLESWEGSGPGSYTGTDNPAVVAMDGPVHQTAILGPRFEGAGYDFTISASDTDPFRHTETPAGTARPLYLWATCVQRGLAALEASVSGSLAPISFAAASGVYSVGSPEHLLLAIAGCPTGESVNRLLGSWMVDDTGGTFCLAAGSVTAVDCDDIRPSEFQSPGVIGFTSDGSEPCSIGTNGCEDPPPPPPPPPPPVPDPVLLSDLQVDVTPGDRTVRISWVATAEGAAAGFHVYRSDESGDDPVRLTSTMLRGTSFEWIDSAVEPDRTYGYSVGAERDTAPERMYGPVTITTPAWVPFRNALAPAAPNPSLGAVELRFSLAEPGRARIEIYDVSGRRVRDLVQADYPAGEHVVPWDGRDDAGRVAPAGMYFARFSVGGSRQVRKLLRLSVD